MIFDIIYYSSTIFCKGGGVRGNRRFPGELYFVREGASLATQKVPWSFIEDYFFDYILYYFI